MPNNGIVPYSHADNLKNVCYLDHYLNSWLFDGQMTFYHLNTRLVCYSYPHLSNSAFQNGQEVRCILPKQQQQQKFDEIHLTYYSFVHVQTLSRVNNKMKNSSFFTLLFLSVCPSVSLSLYLLLGFPRSFFLLIYFCVFVCLSSNLFIFCLSLRYYFFAFSVFSS